MITKYCDLAFLDQFRERKFIFKEGQEFLVEVLPDKEYQAYFIAENGKLVESDIYKIKTK
jgi:hypothetical protein